MRPKRMQMSVLVSISLAVVVFAPSKSYSVDEQTKSRWKQMTNKQWEAEAIKSAREKFKACDSFLVTKHKKPEGTSYFLLFSLLRNPVTFKVRSDPIKETEKWSGLLWRGRVTIEAPMSGESWSRWGQNEGFIWHEQNAQVGISFAANDQEGLGDDPFRDNDYVAESWDCTEVTEIPRFPKNAGAATPTAVSKSGLGAAVTTKQFQFQIASATLTPSVGKSPLSSTASEGGTYVAIRWSYKNISTKPVGALRMPNLHLVSPGGEKYDPDIEASAYFAATLNLDAKVVSDLNPGIRVNDADVFEVSKELFDPGAWKLLIDADQQVTVELLQLMR